jgi:glycosyltransferase involved in cell wall biosynthesis
VRSFLGTARRTRPRGVNALVRTAFVATFPPRHCGIATFTHHLAAVTDDREIAVLHPPEQPSSYPIEVHHRIRKDEASDYARAARSLNDCVDVVSIQHDYGIWGGHDGEYVLDFARVLRVPAVVTLHTVLRNPTSNQREITSELTDLAAATVVMSRSAADLLGSAYGVDARRVHVIPHGVPNLPLVDPATIKPGLGVAGRDVILSFGLMGPGKGYELAIAALPAIVARHPKALYVIVGATYPEVILRDGETYRRSLVDHVRRLGMEKHVQFVDRFIGRVELTQWLEAADVFVTPFPDLDQMTSGTLTYAMGAGRAIVSTPYAHANELLADGRGMLVAPGSGDGLARAINALLDDPILRAEMGRKAYEYSRGMVWSALGADYGRLFAHLAAGARAEAPAARLMTVHA